MAKLILSFHEGEKESFMKNSWCFWVATYIKMLVVLLMRGFAATTVARSLRDEWQKREDVGDKRGEKKAETHCNE